MTVVALVGAHGRAPLRCAGRLAGPLDARDQRLVERAALALHPAQLRQASLRREDERLHVDAHAGRAERLKERDAARPEAARPVEVRTGEVVKTDTHLKDALIEIADGVVFVD